MYDGTKIETDLWRKEGSGCQRSIRQPPSREPLFGIAIPCSTPGRLFDTYLKTGSAAKRLEIFLDRHRAASVAMVTLKSRVC